MKVSKVRNRIVETASDLFYQNGYNRTGINEIIDKAGIAKATLYSHFRSKDEICLAYLKLKDDVFTEDLNTFLEQLPEGKERVLGLFGFLRQFYNSEGFNGCWCINLVSELPREDKKVRQELVRQKENLINTIQGLLAYTEVPEEQLTAKARQVYMIYEGAVAECHLHNAIWPVNEAENICKQII